MQVPQIESYLDVLKAAEATRFAPRGHRGVCRYVRAACYSGTEKSTYFQQSNKETMLIAQIEGLEGIKNIREILKVEDLDIIFIGPYDLSQSLGIPGEVENPLVKEKINEVIEMASKNDKLVGIFVDDIDLAKSYAKMGIQYISYAVDVGLIYSKFQADIQNFKS